jgi:AcrR family transcriptional regulator
LDLHQVVQLLRAGASDRAIARLTRLNRRTVARYRRWATEHGALTGPLPGAGELEARIAATRARRPPARPSMVALYRDEVRALRSQGLGVAAIRARLIEAHGQPVSYSAVWRLVRGLEGAAPAEAPDRAAVGGPRRPRAGRGRVMDGGAVTAFPAPPASRDRAPVASLAPDRPLVAGRLLNGERLSERHAHLVASATGLLLHRGFHRTSVRDIAAAAGWQIGTLYLYISRKEDILQLILEAIMQAFLAELHRVERQDTARETLRLAAERYFRAVGRMHRELRLLYRESASLDPRQRQFGMQREIAQRDFFADIIRWGIATGEFRPVRPELFAHTIIMTAHMWGLKGWALIRDLSLDEFIAEQLDLLFTRLAPVPAPSRTAPMVAERAAGVDPAAPAAGGGRRRR